MGTKLRVFVIVVIVALGLGTAAVGQAQEGTDSSIIGPYTEILIPFEDLPALNEDLAYHPVIDQYESGATLQVMYVLEDPRDVPLARYAYYTDDYGVIAPNNSPVDWPLFSEAMEDLKSYSPKTINVYVRVQAPANQQVPDPLFSDKEFELRIEEGAFITPRYNGDRPALSIPLTTNREDREEGFPCAVPEYADGTQPYQIPGEIDGGLAIGRNGLYDPKAYAPPQPWYYNENNMLEAGEVREGWVSCLVPDIPLDEIQIEAWYEYIQTIPTPGPSPTPIEGVGVGVEVECLIVDSLDDPACETSCCALSVPTELIPTVDATEQAMMYPTKEVIGDYLTWSYFKAVPIPEVGISFDDVTMYFLNEKGDVKNTQGTAVFETAAVIQIEGIYQDDFYYVSKVVVDPVGFSDEDLQGYTLHRVDVDVEIYEQANATGSLLGIMEMHNEDNSTFEKYMQVNFQFFQSGGIKIPNPTEKLPFAFTFLYEPESPYDGYAFVELGGELLFRDDNKSNGGLPKDLWFSIGPRFPEVAYHGETELSGQPRYAAKGASINNTNLVSSTTMCDVVDCLEVSDPKDADMVPRTVPVMCAGEWSNNFIIDGVDLLPAMYYVGEAWTASRYYMEILHLDLENRVDHDRVLLYQGKILGGATPWWTHSENWGAWVIDGNVVDLETGNYLYNRVNITPYYSKIDENDLSQGFFTPGSFTIKDGGWMGEVIDQKLLVFGVIDLSYDEKHGYLTDKNTVFLFKDEGPAWATDCQRRTITNLVSEEIYASSESYSVSEVEGDQHWMGQILPGMDYPISLPIVSGEIYEMGDYGDKIYFGKNMFTPKQVKIVSGKPTVPTIYVESEDKYYPGENFPSINNRVLTSGEGGVVIPPDTTYIRVRISVDHLDNYGGLPGRCSLSTEDFQLVYQGYYPITAIGDLKTPPLFPCDEKDYSVWMHFFFPSLEFEQEKLLLSIRGGPREPWYFWRLTDK